MLHISDSGNQDNRSNVQIANHLFLAIVILLASASIPYPPASMPASCGIDSLYDTALIQRFSFQIGISSHRQKALGLFQVRFQKVKR